MGGKTPKIQRNIVAELFENEFVLFEKYCPEKCAADAHY